MGITLGGFSNDAMNALPSRQLATSGPFGPDAREVAHEKTLPLPAATTTYHYEQFAKHDPTDVHPLPPQQSPIHLGPTGADRGIIIVGGRPGDTVSLNPQPMPPRNAFAQTLLHAGDASSDAAKRGIIIVGGHDQANAELNRAIIIIGGKLR